MTCVECERPMIHHRLWRKTDPEQRAGLAPHRGRGLCVTCYERARRAGTLLDYERSTMRGGDLMDDALWLIDNRGLRYRDLPEALGKTRNALARTIRRAALREDPRALRLAALNNYPTKGSAA